MATCCARILFATVIGTGAAVSSAARAETCPPLQIVASVPMSYDFVGRPLVPVTLGTMRTLMLIDTGGAFSTIAPQAVEALGLGRRRVEVRQYGVSGRYTDEATDVSPFVLGNLVADRIQLMIDLDNPEFDGTHIAGIIGPNILHNYDAEFDFGTNTFRLLSQNHCPGQVIYWPATNAAEIPVEITKDIGHIVVPVTLDGVHLRALIDTGAGISFMPSRVAEDRFGLSLDTRQERRGIAPAWVHMHRFHVLSLEGIEVGNPPVDIIPDLLRRAMSAGPAMGTTLTFGGQPRGIPDISLGVDVLKHLHLYIAYKEQMLYATPARVAGP